MGFGDAGETQRSSEGQNILRSGGTLTPDTESGAAAPSNIGAELIAVTHSHTAEGWIEAHPDVEFARTTLLTVGEPMRSTAPPAAVASPPSSDDGTPTVLGIDGPADLTDLGITLLKQLTERSQSSADVVLVIEDLDAILDAVPLRRAFHFLHVLTALVRINGVTAYYHYDDIAAQTLETISVLFDDEPPHR